VILVALATWLITRDGDDDNASSGPQVETAVPTILSEADLRAWGRAQGTPVYWAGPQPNRKYEVTRSKGGRYYVRYLTPSAEAGSTQPRFLTVGTYPGTNAYGALAAVGRRRGTSAVRTKSGALVVYEKKRPTSVYFAFPGQNFQVEVYDPRAIRARETVLSGRVERLR
jgi:hypothetical protein